MKKVLPFISLLLGFVLATWIIYNLLIEMQPAAKGKNPIPAIVVSGTLIVYGIKGLFKSQQKKRVEKI